jgi:hypothetical protein
MRSKKLLKITGITLLVIFMLALAAHLLIVYRAKQILNYIVMEASNDHYMVRKGKVRFHYFPLRIDARNIQVAPVDTSGKETFYVTSADSLTLSVTRLFSLLSKKHLLLENIRILRPRVEVYDRDTTSDIIKKPLNLALADIQQALLTTLTDFSIKNCKIEDGGLFYKQSTSDSRPLYINHVWLNISNLKTVRADAVKDSIQVFKADVELRIRKPLIQLPDPSMELFLDNLLLDTKRNVFTINRFNLYDRNIQGTVDSVILSNISLHQFKWNRWLRDGVIEIDSLKANNGATFFDLSQKEIFAKKMKPVVPGHRKKYLDFLIHHVEINKIDYGLRLKSASGPFKFDIDGDSLAIGDISLSNDSARPLKIGSVAFKLSDFSNNFDSRKNESSFEKLIIDHNSLQLINYRRTLNFKNIGSGSHINIPSLRVINFSLDDLLQFKLVADRLILDRPSLVIDAQQHKSSKSADEVVAQITASLRPSLSIKELSIVDAQIILLTTQKNGGKLSIEKVNTEINAKELLEAKSVLQMVTSATALSSSGFLVTGPNINLLIRRSKLNKRKDGLIIEKIVGDIGQTIHVDLNDVALANEHTHIDISNLHEIPIEFVDVAGGAITIDLTRRKPGNENTKMPVLHIGHLHTGKIAFAVTTKSAKITMDGVQVAGEQINAEKGFTSWKDLDIQSGQSSLYSKEFIINASAINIQQPGIILAENLVLTPVNESSLEKVSIPKLNLEANFNNTDNFKPVFRKLKIEDPVFEFAKQPAGIKNTGALKIPAFSVDHFIIARPSLKIYGDSTRTFELTAKGGEMNVSGFESEKGSNKLSASGITLNFAKPVVQVNKNSFEPALLMIKATGFSFDAGNKLASAFIDTATVSGLDFSFHENKTIIKSVTAGISSFKYLSSDSLSLSSFLKNKNWTGTSKELRRDTKNHQLTVFNPFMSSSSASFGFDSLHFIPLISRDSFWNAFPFERDYNTIKLGKGVFNNWKISGEKDEREFYVQHATFDNINLLTEKDKTRGPDTIKYRALLARSFERIPIHFSVDTITLNNAFVWHNLIPEKSKRQGSIFFSSINGNLYNVKNFNTLPGDTFRFRLSTNLMGKGDMVVGFRQAYMDSLQGFSLRARMGNFELSSLNSLLVPLVSVKIDRGTVDSMLLAVGANDYVAYGNMDMRYHGLRLALLKKGEKEYFLSKFFNLLINTFVHSSDNSGKNIIFQERLRNKSIFNYWSKIAINGLLSSLGVKRDKKKVRQYNKAIRQGDVPAVDEGLL